MHPLRHPVFRIFFAAQILSLLGTGLLTVALALTAYRVAGAGAAGGVLGALLTLKMVSYVTLSPLAEAMLSRAAPRPALIALDLARMALLLPMAFTGNLWQVAALAFAFFAASAAATPLFQATIPVILKDERAYSQALGLSRLAASAEALLSSALAGIALTIVSDRALFPIASACFAGSAVALLMVRLERGLELPAKAAFVERALRGIRIELRTPRLRGLLMMNLGLALGLAWVLVNTVVYAGLRLDDPTRAYTLLMTAYGAGAGAGALAAPRLVVRLGERSLILAGGAAFGLLTPLILLPLATPQLVLLWAGFGAASSMVLTPGGLVLTRSAHARDWPAVFAAQFSLSHAAWLLAYPLAGAAGVALGAEAALVALGAATMVVTLVAARVWPPLDPAERAHSHADLAPDDPHLAEHGSAGPGNSHSHIFWIDENHPRWAMQPAPGPG